MCGIAGIISDEEPGAREARVSSMLATIAHRGPDGSGVHSMGRATFGHVRLSIVDHEGGAQPMRDVDDRSMITFNGEIYGFQSIRQTLENDGHVFRTRSDTEVILALYARHGRDLTRLLPGMFAFAIFDATANRVLFGRDAFGEKPLFMADGKNGALVFASTTTAVLASGLIDDGVSLRELSGALAHGFVAPRRSIFTSVRPLPPGHVSYTDDGRLVTRQTFFVPEPVVDVSLADASEELAAHMDDAVARTLVADVDVALLLSSGLDSAAVLHHARAHHDDLVAYTYAFRGDDDESAFAASLAQHYATKHVVLDDQNDLARTITDAIDAFDEPMFDSALVPQWAVARAVRASGHKVALTGDGGDEIFGGYPFWYQPAAAHRASSTERVARTLVARTRRRLQLPIHPNDAIHLSVYDDGLAHMDPLRAHIARQRRMSDDDLALLGLPRAPILPNEVSPRGDRDPFLVVNGYDIDGYLPGDILVKIDRAAMSHGLELRAPFLDRALASFALALPPTLRVDTARDRVLFRRVMETRLPKDTLHRRKRGFGAPLGAWMKRDCVARLMKETIRDGRIALSSLMDTAGLDALFSDQHFNSSNNNEVKIRSRQWSLFVLARWALKLAERRGRVTATVAPPVISVLLPVKNAAKTLETALNSVVDQTVSDIEILVENDGSTDATAEILDAAARRDSRIKVAHHGQSAGIAVRLNAALARARAPLIARMDGDDVSHRDRFRRQRAFLESHPDVIAVGAQIEFVDDRERRIAPYPLPLDHVGIDDGHLRGRAGRIAHPTLMARTEAMRDVDGYRNHPRAQDYDLFLRLAEHGELANVDDVLLQFRLHTDQSSNTARPERIDAARKMLRDAWNRRNLGDAPSVFDDETDPSPAEFHANLANVAARAGATAVGFDHAVRAIWLDPTSLSSWTSLARVIDNRLRGGT